MWGSNKINELTLKQILDRLKGIKSTILSGYFWEGVLYNLPQLKKIHTKNLSEWQEAQNQSIRALLRLANPSSNNYLRTFDENVLQSKEVRQAALQLKKFLDTEGSDKANFHTYQDLYAYILIKENSKTELVSLLEIGMGSPRQGSLIAFQKFIVDKKLNYNCIGVDINPLFLKATSRRRLKKKIYFFRYNQLSKTSGKHLLKKIKNLPKVRLIIDDGLHTAEANVQSLINLRELVSNGAIYVIEDVNKNQLPLWKIVPKFFPDLKFQIRNMTNFGPFDNIQVIISRGKSF